MNKDIRLSVEFFDHPKTVKLQRRLGLEAVISLQRLWLWSAQNRPNGQLVNMDAEDIEIAAQWNGEFGKFYECLVELTWLDVNEVICLHDWEEHNSWQARAEERSGKARMSKLAQVNPTVAERLKSEGTTSLTKEQYGHFANASESQSERKTNASDTLAPSPAPSPAPNALREDSYESFVDSEQSTTDEKLPDCPHEEIVALFHEVLPEVSRVRSWGEKRQGHLRARWKETLVRLKKAGKTPDKATGLDWWRRFFTSIRASPWLMGRIVGRNGRPFNLTLPWIVLPDNYDKIFEGYYFDRRTG